MPTDLDDLLTVLYVFADDFLPRRDPSRPGRKPRISAAEVICLAVAQVLLDCPKERRFLRFAKRRLGHLFPYVPGQSGYNKRVRELAPQIGAFLGHLARISPSWCDDLRLIDATPVPCGQSRETVKRSEFAGHAAYGYCAAHSRHFWGFKLYLLAAPDGMPIAFRLVPANEPEREVAAQTFEEVDLKGCTVIGDKGALGRRDRGAPRRPRWRLHAPRSPRRGTPLRLARAGPPVDRGDFRPAEGPALPGAPWGPHAAEPLGAGPPAPARPRRLRLAQLAALGSPASSMVPFAASSPTTTEGNGNQ